MRTDTQVFRTDSTPLAAYLITEGYSLRGTTFKGRDVHFLFDNDDRLNSFVSDFECMHAKANAYQLITVYQGLIKLIKRGSNDR